jgi:hypothetical protein
MLPKEAVYFTTSSGDNVSPDLPPIVPLIPEILFINATLQEFGALNYFKLNK